MCGPKYFFLPIPSVQGNLWGPSDLLLESNREQTSTYFMVESHRQLLYKLCVAFRQVCYAGMKLSHTCVKDRVASHTL